MPLRHISLHLWARLSTTTTKKLSQNVLCLSSYVRCAVHFFSCHFDIEFGSPKEVPSKSFASMLTHTGEKKKKTWPERKSHTKRGKEPHAAREPRIGHPWFILNNLTTLLLLAPHSRFCSHSRQLGYRGSEAVSQISARCDWWAV